MADEIVLLDVTRDDPFSKREKFWGTVRDFSRNCFLPLSIGGFLRSMDDVKRAFDEGADKVVVNTALHETPDFGTAVAEKYGAQALVCSADVRDGWVYVAQGTQEIGICAGAYCSQVVARGAGEILLMDISRDGSLQGYNLDLIREVSNAVTVPVIAVGGMGCWRHAAEGFDAGASACATQVIHHLTDTSLRACKTYLDKQGVPVRL